MTSTRNISHCTNFSPEMFLLNCQIFCVSLKLPKHPVVCMEMKPAHSTASHGDGRFIMNPPGGDGWTAEADTPCHVGSSRRHSVRLPVRCSPLSRPLGARMHGTGRRTECIG